MTLAGVLSLGGWSIIVGLLGSVTVWFGWNAFAEKLTDALVGLRFVTVVGLTIVAEPKTPEMLKSMVSMVPEGGDLCILALASGIGGTTALAGPLFRLRDHTVPRYGGD